MANLLKRAFQARPRPFLRLQKFLQIQEEWSTFKSQIKPHKFKLFLFSLFATYPLYKPYIKYWITSQNIRLQEELQPNQPAPLIIESFVKQRVENILKEPKAKTVGAEFLSDVAKKDVALDAIVSLLIQTAQNETFLAETTALAKELTHDALQNPEVESEALVLVRNLLRNNEIKHEIMDIIKWASQQEASKRELINLWKAVFQDPKLNAASKELFAQVFYEILKEKETVEKLKIFSFYLIGDEAKSTKDKKNMKGLIDIVVDKVAKSYKVENKESELKKVLRDEGDEDVYESIEKRKRSAKSDDQEEKRNYTF